MLRRENSFNYKEKIKSFLGLSIVIHLVSKFRQEYLLPLVILHSFQGILFMAERLIRMRIQEYRSNKECFSNHKKHILFMLIKHQLMPKNLLNNILRNLRLSETNLQDLNTLIVFTQIWKHYKRMLMNQVKVNLVK